MISSQELGVAGELRVMSELILRGFNPAKSYIDNGIDIILSNGIKIQIKTTNRLYTLKGKGKDSESYRFNLLKGEKKKTIKLSDYVDYLICFIVKEQIFLVIPSKELKIKSSIAFGIRTERKNMYEKYINNFDQMRGGV